MKLPRTTLVAVLLLLATIPTSAGTAAGSEPAPDLVRVACSIPHAWLLRTWLGNRADRSPELQILPKYPNFVGSGFPHVGPWGYAQNVPILWYGPGHVAAAGVVQRPVTLADIAPTQAQLLNFDFPAPDGTPMTEAVLPGQDPPRLLVLMVWDAGGRDVLSTWPHEWPYLHSLISKGTWYEHATVGSSPTSTAQDHSSIGTGAFPKTSGIVSHHMRFGSSVVGPFTNGPDLLMRPTLADLYDRAMGNKPIVGEVATVNIHLGMLGHGAMWGGGDRDLLVLRELAGATTQGAEGGSWNIPDVDQPYFEFPDWVKDLPPLSHDFATADASDGAVDGSWEGHEIGQQKGGFDTPARIPNQTRLIEELIEREGLGKDDVPDLLFVNYKLIDALSHIWTMNSPEMRDSVRVQDEYLGKFVDFLNQQVGENNWAMVVTADHGAVPDPKVSGAFQISSGALADQLRTKFDNDDDNVGILQGLYQTGIFVNTDELQQNGYTLDDMSRFIMSLTQSQTAGTAGPQPGHENDKVFQAAFRSDIMPSLPCLPEARQ